MTNTALTTTINPALAVIDGKITTTSCNVAKHFKKSHKHVLRDIDSTWKVDRGLLPKVCFKLRSLLILYTKGISSVGIIKVNPLRLPSEAQGYSEAGLTALCRPQTCHCGFFFVEVTK